MAALADEVVAVEDLAEVMHNNMNSLEVRCSRCLPVHCTCWCLEVSTGCKLSFCTLEVSHTPAPIGLHSLLAF